MKKIAMLLAVTGCLCLLSMSVFAADPIKIGVYELDDRRDGGRRRTDLGRNSTRP